MGSGVQTPTVATLGAAQAACVAQADGSEGVVFAVAAGLVGTITFEGSIDGVTFFPLPAFGTTAGAATAGAFVNPGAQLFYVAGGPALKTIQCRCSAYTSGSAIVTGTSDDNGTPSLVPMIALGGGSGNASASQTGAFTRHRAVSAATDNPTNVKATAGNVPYLLISNDGIAKAFMKLYDKATAPSNADTPVSTILLPLGALQVPINDGALRHPFALGIGYRLTGLLADADNTAVVAGAIAVNMLYA